MLTKRKKEIFEQYFYDINQYSRIHGEDGEYIDIITNINEKMSFFETTASIVNGTISATNMYRLGTVYSAAGITNRGIIVEEVQPDELVLISMSPLTTPKFSTPVYVRTAEYSITDYPTGVSDSCSYVSMPSTPSWAYVVVNGKAMWDPSLTTDFELHPSEETELVYKILKFAGVSMQRNDIMDRAQGLESLQIQQEKQ